VIVPDAGATAWDHHVSDETVLANKAMDFLAVAFVSRDNLTMWRTHYGIYFVVILARSSVLGATGSPQDGQTIPISRRSRAAVRIMR
jgi:hypothetical protein